MTRIIGVAAIVLVGASWVQVAGAASPSTQPATQPSTQPARELTLDLGGDVTMKLALIPAGKFLMGSPNNEKDRSRDEGPQREVTIARPFYMGVYEVTQEQYQAVMGRNPSHFKKSARNPVEQVSWNDASGLCQALSRKTGKTVRLPTEAEWEYACRAGSETRFSFGDDEGELCKYGNYCDRSNTSGLSRQDKSHDDGFDKTAPVGSYKPNAWGLYDMHGNVWEWCSDWYDGSYYAASLPGGQAGTKNVDPAGPVLGTLRVLRGGCWRSNPGICRSAHRNTNPPGHRHGLIGFRAVVSPDLPGRQASLK